MHLFMQYKVLIFVDMDLFVLRTWC